MNDIYKAIKEKKERRVCQGEIYSDIEYIEKIELKEGILRISRISFPLVIVLTQDCDLEQEYNGRKKNNNDKTLFSIIVVPIYNYDFFKKGEHLNLLKLTMQPLPNSLKYEECLKNNQIPRYHYLEFPKEIEIHPSIIDFKHYFTANLYYIENSTFKCKIPCLYRERISQRFSDFLARIGLP